MKTATVADLRNKFRRVSSWIENGETVQIHKRGHLFATLIPPSSPKKSKLVKIDFRKQLKEVWGDRVFTDAEIKEMKEAELEGQEG